MTTTVIAEQPHRATPYREAAWGLPGGPVWSASCTCGWSWGRQARHRVTAERAAALHNTRHGEAPS